MDHLRITAQLGHCLPVYRLGTSDEDKVPSGPTASEWKTLPRLKIGAFEPIGAMK